MTRPTLIVDQRAVVLAVLLAGCGGNVTVARGFDSHQVLPVRDPTLRFDQAANIQGQDPTLVYTIQAGGDAGAPTYWSLDLATGALQDLSPSLQPPVGVSPAASNRYECATDVIQAGTQSLQITDTTSGAKMDVDDVTTFLGCAQDDGTLLVFRRGPADGQQVLWAGPYDQLAPVDLPLEIFQVTPSWTTSGVSRPPSALVIAAPATEPGARGIYTLDLLSHAMAGVVPAAPASAAWAAGAPQAGSLDSTSVAPDLGVSSFNGHYLYARAMSDGGTTLFAGPFSSGPATELALLQLTPGGPTPPTATVQIGGADDAAQPQPVPPIAAWQVAGTDGASGQLLVWDDAASEVTLCPSSPNLLETGVVSPDGAHVLFRPIPNGVQPVWAPLQLLSLPPDQPHTCVQVGHDWDAWADFSGDGTTLAWITKPRVGPDSDLWIADSDGSNATTVLSGDMRGARFIRGTNHLELSYAGDLVWLDVRDPTHFSHVAEQVFGDPANIGSSWFIAGYDYSTQDASGLLGVVNLDSGTKLSISPAVSQYLVAPQVERVDGGALFDLASTGLDEVVYLVRGRNASSQDGIWVATVRAADLP